MLLLWVPNHKKMTAQNTAIPKVFIGIDIHKASWRVHFATDLFLGKGMTMPPDPLKLRQHVEKNYPDHEIHCAYEAGCCGYSAHRAFEAFSWHSLVFNPADISRTGKTQYQKTDKIDAKLICTELRDSRLKGVTVPDIQREHLRCLFRQRNNLAQDLRRIKARIKSQLLYLGISLPEQFDNDNWSKAFIAWIEALEFENETMKASLFSFKMQYEFVSKSIREVSLALRKYCITHYNKDFKLLTSIPGIGAIVACSILSELGDLRRFSNFKQLAGYVGLMPCMYETGNQSKTCGITPRGNKIIRTYFIEAAWQAVRFDPVMQKYFRSHHGRDRKTILIKVARKLLSRTLAVIKHDTPYQTGVIQ